MARKAVSSSRLACVLPELLMPTQGRDEEHRLPRTSCNVARGLTQRHWTMRSISAYGGMHHPTSGGSDQPPTKWKDTAMSRTASRYPDPTASTQADTEATQPGASVSLLRPSGRRLDWIPDREKPVVPEEIAAICSGCPLQPACLQWAVEQDEPGYWGGTTSTERQRIVRGMTLGELQRMRAQNRDDEDAQRLHSAAEEPSMQWYRRGCTCRGCKAVNAARASRYKRTRQTRTPLSVAS